MAFLLLGTMGLVAFGALTWIILLASVSALHDSYTEFTNENYIADQLSLPWWVVWQQFLLLIAIAVAAAMGVLQKAATTLGHFLAAAFALQVYICHLAATLVRVWQDVEGANAKYETRAEAVLAGLILTAISTALLIIWIGSIDTITGLAVGKKQEKYQAPPSGSTPGMSHFNPVGVSHNGSYNGAPVMPPPPVGMQPGHYSPSPVPTGAPLPPGHEDSPSGFPPLQGYEQPPGAHPLPGVGSSPSPEDGFEKQTF